ncbi:MAG: pyridoxal-phosphate dependent enzyme [Dehalococcoidia bacterium]
MALICSVCGTAWEEVLRPVRCQGCAGALIWRPEGDDETEPVTLGEGATPVIRLDRWAAVHGLGETFAKLEHLQPTGSFKDRGSAMLVARARTLGARRLVEDSSGNAGASMAAYAARAGIACTVYAPAAAPVAKLRQVLACGGELRRIEGSREDVTVAAMNDHEGRAYYAGHNTNAYFLHGMRSFADEIINWFAADPPEHLIMPVGGGSLYAGAWLGLAAARDAGRIRRLPALHLVQAAGCAPLVAAAEQGADDAVPVPRSPTVAGGITIEHPARGAMLLRALRETGGSAVAVAEEAILPVRRELSVIEGLDIEPTSAVAFAGLLTLHERGVIPPDARVLIAVTGAGWKDPQTSEEESER